MTNVTARINAKGKHFEILVDLEEALKVRSGKGDINLALQSQKIFKDLKKGDAAGSSDLEESFGTLDLLKIAEKIIKDGEVQKTQDFRDAEREKKIKQVVELLLKNCVDQHGRPYTAERLTKAIDEVHYSFTNKPAEQQMNEVVQKIKEILPIKLDVKRVKITIPAQYTGQAYGLIGDYKEKEEWLSNGNLEVVLAIPAGLAVDFYEKLNSITHGAVQSQEISS